MEDLNICPDIQTLERLYGLLQIREVTHPKKAPIQTLDDKAKLVLKKLLDDASRQALLSHCSKAVQEQPSVASNMKCTGHEDEKQVLDDQPQCSALNPYGDANTSQIKKRCRNCGKNRKRTTNSAKNNVDSIEKAKEFGDTKAPMQNTINEAHKNWNGRESGSMGFQANRLKSEPRYHYLDHNRKNKNKKKMVNVKDGEQLSEIRTREDNLVLVRGVGKTIKEGNTIGTNNQLSMLNRLHDSKDISTQYTESNIEASPERKPVEVIEDINELVPSLNHRMEKQQEEKSVSVAEAIKLFEARIRGNHNESPQRVMESVKNRSVVSANQKSAFSESNLVPGQIDKPVGASVEKYLQLSQIPSQTEQRLKSSTTPTGVQNFDATLEDRNIETVSHFPAQKDQKSILSQNPNADKNELERHNTSLTKPIRRKNSSRKNQTQKRRTSRLPLLTSKMGPTVIIDDLANPRRTSKTKLPCHDTILPTLIHYKPTPTDVGRNGRQMTRPQRSSQLVPRNKNQPHQQRSRWASTSSPASSSSPLVYSSSELVSHKKNLQHQKKARGTTASSASSPLESSESSSPSSSEYAQLVPHDKRLPLHRGARSIATSSLSSSFSSYTNLTNQDTSCSITMSTDDSESDSQQPRMVIHPQIGGVLSSKRYPHKMTNHHSKYTPPPRHAGPTTVSCSNSEKGKGRFRRFKDKLAIIFHHHHHHHHHHHQSDNDTPHNGHRSIWKHVFHRKNKEQGIMKKVKKPTLAKIPPQQRHFHTLIGGLFRHLLGSKKSKPSKDDIRRLERTLTGKREVTVQKWHQWQKVNRSGKRRVKIGFTSKRPQLTGT